MPRHKPVTTCLKDNVPISRFCPCIHCTLGVCASCGAYEGSLTTDCPGAQVDIDRQKEVYETSLDYTDARGWHLGAPMERRSPRFETTTIPVEPPDPRTVVAPSINWGEIDHIAHLHHNLSQKAIAWVIADRVAEDHAAALTRIEDEVAAQMPKGEEPNAHARALLNKLEHEKIEFRIANQHAEKCDDEYRQAAQQLVAKLEDVG